jgi:hypothetical protein
VCVCGFVCESGGCVGEKLALFVELSCLRPYVVVKEEVVSALTLSCLLTRHDIIIVSSRRTYGYPGMS